MRYDGILLLSQSIAVELRHLLSQAPRAHEYCGFLLGKKAEDADIATTFVAVSNAAATPGRCAVADVEVDRVNARAVRQNAAVLAFVHTHPGGSLTLSHLDRACLRRSPHAWLIAALGRNEELQLRGYAAGSGHRIAIRVAD
jgi:proteasome lid subunit RPN8/RPN11